MTNTEQCSQDRLRPHELAGLRRRNLQPMTLDTRGCPGQADGDKLCELCPGCERFGHGYVARFIAPRAALQPDGGWDCNERRVAWHAVTVHLPGAAAQTTEFGGYTETQVAVVGVAA